MTFSLSKLGMECCKEAWKKENAYLNVVLAFNQGSENKKKIFTL